MPIGAGALIVGGVAASAMSGGSSQAPQPQQLDPTTIGTNSLQTQLDLAPAQYSANQQYGPLYGALNNQMLSSNILGDSATNNPGLINIYSQATPQLSSIQSQANTAQRTANINDMQTLGGQAVSAYEAANPQLAQTSAGLQNYINNINGQSPLQAGVPQLGAASQAGTSLAQPTTAMGTSVSASPIANPLMADAMNYQQMSPIDSQLQQQASSELALGGSLSAQQQNTVQQATRGAYAARGLDTSNMSLGAEVVNTDAASQALLQQRQQFAQSAQSQISSDQAANRNFALNTESALMQPQYFNANTANTLSQFNAGQANSVGTYNAGQLNSMGQYDASQANNFAQAQFGTNAAFSQQNTNLTLQQQQANIANQMSLANLYSGQAQGAYGMAMGSSAGPSQAMSATSQGAGVSNQPQMFDPFNSSIMSIYNANYNATNATNIANANSSAAMYGSGMSAMGSLGSAAMMYCWVAREVFGAKSAKWRRFRLWMLTRAPAEIRTLYLHRGERFARLIASRPQLRTAVRNWMELVLEGEAQANAA